MITKLELKSLCGRSLPSAKFGAWIVESVSDTIEGRSRLVSANLKAEIWMATSELVESFRILNQTNYDGSD